MLKNWLKSWSNADANLRWFILGVLFLGINNGILTSSFNNYMFDQFSVSAQERGLIEFPRELPGFLLIFITGALGFLSMRGWGVCVGLFSAIGVLGMGYLAPSMTPLIVWLLFWSAGDHLFMTVQSAVGLQLARANAEGRRLGQLEGARNLSMIAGTLAVWGFMEIRPGSYGPLYALAAVMAVLASMTFARLRLPEDHAGAQRRFVFKWKYRYFYLLNILFGARKQLFLTFGPWVLISQFDTKPQTIALLLMAASAIGVVFRQYFGIVVDKLGERFMLTLDGVVFLFICLGYVWAPSIPILYGLYILDNLMFATKIARTTYLNGIIDNRSEISATVSLGITLDHVVSMTMPALGGLMWAAWGYEAVFLFAAVIALANIGASLMIQKRTPVAVPAA